MAIPPASPGRSATLAPMRTDTLKIVVVGTRPNFTKHFALEHACRKFGVECVVAHTGQHYDDNMSDVFFDELGLTRPAHSNRIEKGTPAQVLGQIMTFLENVLYTERPDVTVVYGDVTSTMAGALASARLGIPVAHIEAGVRAGNIYNPEELNRRVTEVSSCLLFAHIEDAYQNLLQAGFPRNQIVLAGDIVHDSLLLAMERFNIAVTDEGYAVVTFHRAENTDDPVRLAQICRALVNSRREIRFPVHPRTRDALRREGLWDGLAACGHIRLMEPLGFIDNVRLLAGANRVVSDSGGLRREGYILGKPVVSLTSMVWVPAMVAAGWELVADVDGDKILFGLHDFTPPASRPAIFGDGTAAERVVRVLTGRFGRAGQTAPVMTGLANQNSLVSRAFLPPAADMAAASDGRESVSVVIPCYNEEESLPTLFERLDALRHILDNNTHRLEYILVDDGSTDATWQKLQATYGGSSLVKLIRTPRNMGYGGALKVGMVAAETDIVVTADADTNYDVREIPKLLAALTPGVDITTASPFLHEGDWHYPAHRFILSRGVVVLYRLALGRAAGDLVTFTAGFRAYRRNVVAAVLPDADDFLANAEIISRALLAGMTVAQIPATIYDRKFGQSKMKTFRMIFRHLDFIARLALGRVKPRPGGSVPGGSAT